MEASPLTVVVQKNKKHPQRLVPEGKVPTFRYVHRHQIRFVDGAGMQRDRLDWWLDQIEMMGTQSPFLAPLGFWKGDEFWIMDGRHRGYAQLICGREYLLVCWYEDEP